MRNAHVRAFEPVRTELNSRYFPSAEKRGFELSVLGDVYRVASPPAVGTTQTSLWRLLSFSRTVVTVNATSFPSGDTAGALSVVTLYQSAGVNARRAPLEDAVVAVAGRACAASSRAGASCVASSAVIAIGSERRDVCVTVAPHSKWVVGGDRNVGRVTAMASPATP